MDRLGGSFGSHDADDHTDYDPLDDGPAAEAPPSPVGQDERRMQVRAYNHWASQLGNRNFPNIEDLVPDEMDDFGPYSVLLDFSMGIDNPAVQYLGGKLAGECDADSGAIETLSDVPSRSLLSRITDHYMQILANQAPIGFEAEFVNQRAATVLYRGILLPYSSDNETIDFIFGVINWKEMADRQTADALLLEIDQALGDFSDDSPEQIPVETPETLTEQVAVATMTAWEEDDILDLGGAEILEDSASDALPLPRFGQMAFGDAGEEDEEFELETVAISASLHGSRGGRGVDALGNRVGGGAYPDFYDGTYSEGDEEEPFDPGIRTAADYGLPEWDDEPEAEDVDGVVDPLADEEVSSSLTSLVSRGLRHKKAVDLSMTEPQPAVPQAYEGDEIELPTFVPQDFATRPGVPDNDDTAVAAAPRGDSDSDAGPYSAADAGATPEGLYDCLAAARELAQAALSTEDRSRKALYAAVDRAYDFSFEAEANPDDYAELIVDNGLTVQDRAPMTPIVKLVFGAEYDKTRLTEYAAVLMHARRIGVARGEVGNWLRKADGGLKGIVNAERRARREEQGKPVEDTDGVRAALARKLRKLDGLDLGDLASDGPEFALVMVRRTDAGELVIVGEVPEDIPLIEKAARKLLG